MLIQENLIEFLIQSVYLIYARLIVYAIQNITYPKGYALFIKSTYSKYIIWYYYSKIFYILLYNMWLCNHDCDMYN